LQFRKFGHNKRNGSPPLKIRAFPKNKLKKPAILVGSRAEAKEQVKKLMNIQIWEKPLKRAV